MLQATAKGRPRLSARPLGSAGNFVAVLSVDLAYKDYADIGAVVLRQSQGAVQCDLVRIPLTGVASPDALAGFLDRFCVQAGIRVLLLDGPQGWKAKENGLIHSRRCERELNTPAKTGEPESVKPANYMKFVLFSIAVFDALACRGWQRLASVGSALAPEARILIESFPLSAWRVLRIDALPAKAKAKPADIERRLTKLQELFPLRLTGTPTHDELQALVAGLAGLAFERNDWKHCAVSGVPPLVEEHRWREGFILNATDPMPDALSRSHKMKRIAKLACFVLLGFMVAAVIYSLLVFGVLEPIRSGSGRSPEAYLGMAFQVMMPVALFLGSSLTGYLSGPHLRTWFGLIVVSPGLYPSLFMITVNVVMVYMVKDTSLSFTHGMFLLGVFLSWFLSSWAGVWLGCFVRSRRNGNRTNRCA